MCQTSLVPTSSTRTCCAPETVVLLQRGERALVSSAPPPSEAAGWSRVFTPAGKRNVQARARCKAATSNRSELLRAAWNRKNPGTRASTGGRRRDGTRRRAPRARAARAARRRRRPCTHDPGPNSPRTANCVRSAYQKFPDFQCLSSTEAGVRLTGSAVSSALQACQLSYWRRGASRLGQCSLKRSQAGAEQLLRSS